MSETEEGKKGEKSRTKTKEQRRTEEVGDTEYKIKRKDKVVKLGRSRKETMEEKRGRK